MKFGHLEGVQSNPILTGQQQSPWYQSSKRWGTNTHFPSPSIYLRWIFNGFYPGIHHHEKASPFDRIFVSLVSKHRRSKIEFLPTPRPRPLPVSKICCVWFLPGGLLVGQGGGKALQAWKLGFGGHQTWLKKIMVIWREFSSKISRR